MRPTPSRPAAPSRRAQRRRAARRRRLLRLLPAAVVLLAAAALLASADRLAPTTRRAEAELALPAPPGALPPGPLAVDPAPEVVRASAEAPTAPEARRRARRAVASAFSAALDERRVSAGDTVVRRRAEAGAADSRLSASQRENGLAEATTLRAERQAAFEELVAQRPVGRRRGPAGLEEAIARAQEELFDLEHTEVELAGYTRSLDAAEMALVRAEADVDRLAAVVGPVGLTPRVRMLAPAAGAPWPGLAAAALVLAAGLSVLRTGAKRTPPADGYRVRQARRANTTTFSR